MTATKSTLQNEQMNSKSLDKKQLRRLALFAKPYKKLLFITIFLMFLAAITGLIGPYFLKIVIDYCIPNKDFSALLLIAVVYLASLGLHYVFNRYKISLANKVGQSILFDIRTKLFNHVESLSFGFFDSTSTGRIIVRIVNDVNTLNHLFTNGIINVVTEFAMLFVAAAIMITIHPTLAAITLFTALLFVLPTIFIRVRLKRKWRLARSKLSNLNSYIHESIIGMKVTRSYVRQKKNREIFEGVMTDVLKTWINAACSNGFFSPLVNLLSYIGTIIIYVYGFRLLEQDGVTLGVLIAFGGYLSRFWSPINTLSNFYNQLITATASSERIFELLDMEASIKDDPNATDLSDITGHVSFKNVTFKYNGEKPVLKNVSFEVSAGETIALVGATGSGKSTIANLITRFYDAQEGQVLIEGMDVKKLTTHSLRQNIGVMLQDSFIFSGTVLENIKYGNPEADFDEVVNVAKAVGAHDFIMQMENQYETNVNERGSRLSIGQKQLIAFARVLLKNPKILILDEATSGVDTQTEVTLQRAVQKLLSGRTSFVIAHRLSTIRNADRIMVVDNGEIKECGTHCELMAQKGMYCNLYNVQYHFLNAM